MATLAPDLAVICEAALANPYAPSLTDAPVSWHAQGSLPAKALAVAGFRAALERVDGIEDRGQWGVAARHDSGIGVLGVWSVPGPRRRYGDEILAILETHSAWIADGNVVVAGDFNIDANGVGNGAQGAELFSTLTERLSTLGLLSAYHAWTGEAFGDESRMTHFHLRKADRGFHIDFCFVPNAWRTRIRCVSVGEPGQWLGYSDHMPLIVDLDLAL